MRRDFVVFVFGIVVAAVMLPASVAAASSLFQLQGYGGTVAQVDLARQLLVAESDPRSFLTETAGSNGFNSCVVVDSRPSTTALILRQVRVQVTDSTFDSFHTLYMFPNKTCSGTPILIYEPTQLGSHTETLEPGFPIKASAGVSAQWLATGTYAVVQIYGYRVPAAAVP